METDPQHAHLPRCGPMADWPGIAPAVYRERWNPNTRAIMGQRQRLMRYLLETCLWTSRLTQLYFKGATGTSYNPTMRTPAADPAPDAQRPPPGGVGGVDDPLVVRRAEGSGVCGCGAPVSAAGRRFAGWGGAE